MIIERQYPYIINLSYSVYNNFTQIVNRNRVRGKNIKRRKKSDGILPVFIAELLLAGNQILDIKIGPVPSSVMAYASCSKIVTPGS